ncbi:hypothetical protein ACHAWC_006190 [Mediolabrus comicus]
MPLYLEAWEEVLPTNAPSIASSNVPSASPSNVPSVAPSDKPSLPPSESPSNVPSVAPSDKPSLPPSESPSNVPSVAPSNVPSTSVAPSDVPSVAPSNVPSTSAAPSDEAQSNVPSASAAPSNVPSVAPSNVPSTSHVPTVSAAPSNVLSVAPSNVPSESHVPSVSAAPSCQGQLRTARNICLALDESSSVCYPYRTGCDNWRAMLSFSKTLVTALEAPDSNFSVVTFAYYVDIDQQLSPANATLNTLDNIVYARGSTNTHLGIDDCQSTLANSTVENTIVLISDGAPSSESAAYAAADTAEAAGTNIVSVFIGTESSGISFMETISSTNTVHLVSDFDDLPNIVGTVLTDVIC